MAARPIMFEELTSDTEALFDISNRKRLGITENEIIESLLLCMKELVQAEREDEIKEKMLEE